jgi:hypothetical protein
MPGAYYHLGLRDSSNEIGKTQWNIGDLTALSIAGALTQMGALEAAIDAVTLGAVASSSFGDSDNRAYVRPTDAQSQRGVKWTVAWEDTVTFQRNTNTIPTANLDLLPTVGGNRVEDLDLTAGVGLALKDAIEELCKSPAGNPITVLRVYYAD